MYLGIDLGTSSMKCLLLGEEQEILFSVNSEDIPPVSYTHLTLPTTPYV